jgi:hypothetical protein
MVENLVTTQSDLAKILSETLDPHQFRRNGFTWNRHFSDFVDVVELQVSKSQAAYTLNVGIAEKFAIHACWGIEDQDAVEEPSCTIRKRLGELLYGRDIWVFRTVPDLKR